MVLVGLTNCTKCEAKEKDLKEQGVDYEYFDFKDLSLISQRKISRAFRDETGAIDFPVIIDDRDAYKI